MICHERELVYLHPTKTGGTSVEKLLLKDVLSTMTPDCYVNPADKRKILDRCAIRDARSRQHWPCKKLIAAFPEAESWRKIVTIRHPYDRVKSEFRYQVGGNRQHLVRRSCYETKDLNRAITCGALWRNGYAWHGHPQISYLCKEVEIIRFESLQEDWDNVVGIGKLGHHNKGAEIGDIELSDESKELIQKRWPDDFEELGYER